MARQEGITGGALAPRWGRRAWLAAVPALLAPPPLRAASHGGALGAARRAGALRVGIAVANQLPARPPARPDAPPRDVFGEGLGLRIAALLNLRAELEQIPAAGAGPEWLNNGLVDVALSAPVMRPIARQVMLARPHFALEIVVLAPREEYQRRRLAQWTGVRLAAFPHLLQALEDLGQPVELLDTLPVPDVQALEAALLAGEVFGLIATSLQARAIQQRHPARGLQLRSVLAVQPFAAAVGFGEHDLLRAVDQAMMLALEQGDVAALFREAYGLPLPPPPGAR